MCEIVVSIAHKMEEILSYMRWTLRYGLNIFYFKEIGCIGGILFWHTTMEQIILTYMPLGSDSSR